MIRVKKSVCGILSTLLLVPFISSCAHKVRPDIDYPDKHNSSDTSQSGGYQKEDLTEDEITLVVWESPNDIDTWIKQAGKKFNEIYPNIHIECYEADFSASADNLISGEYDLPQPDLFASPHDKVPQLVDADIILPAKNYEEITTSTLSAAYSALFYKDIMYGYPTARETYALFYNKSLLNSSDVPDTWNDMLTFTAGISKLFHGKYGFVFQCNSVFYLTPFMSENNNQLFQSPDKSGLLTPEALNGINIAKSFFPYLPENAKDMTLTEIESLFLNNEAAIIMGGSWFIAKAEQSNIDFGIAPLPSFTEGGAPSLSLSGVRGMFVHSETKYPDEAAAFAKFLTSKEMQQLRMEITGSLPAVNIEIDNDMTGDFLNQLEYSYCLPNIAEMSRFWEYNAVFCDEIFDGADVGEALAKYDHYIKTGSTEGYAPFPSDDKLPETEPTESIISE